MSIAHNNLIIIYELLNNYEKAEEEYQKAINRDSTYVLGYRNLGKIYRRTGRTENAIEMHQNALSFQNDSTVIKGEWFCPLLSDEVKKILEEQELTSIMIIHKKL